MQLTEGAVLGSRFEIGKLLGAGASGSVWECYDRVRRGRVALKLLRSSDGRALYRFKQEFRSLADLQHPNLVKLYELHSDDNGWLFTMEYIRGARPFGPERDWDGTLQTDAEAVPASPSDSSPISHTEIERGFQQLAVGLEALHHSGKLHRDLKPSNVLVAEDGRVVLVDFGLVADLNDHSGTVELAGTPVYMSPEQMGLLELGPASDWYSVGVMLWEALVGRPPFDGALNAIAAAKRQPPPDPRTQRDVPAHLAELAIALLNPNPEQRPDGISVLRTLAATPRRAVSGPVPPQSSELIGRSSELAELRAAREDCAKGHAMAVIVQGSSGMGKSALLEHFLEELKSSNRDAIVLSGRCFERERIPFKALDRVVDGLSRWMSRLPSAERSALAPRHREDLVSSFPVLGRVLLDGGGSLKPPVPDHATRRQNSAEALTELLRRIAETREVVLFVDDLQWSDRDSAALFRSLLRVDAGLLLLVSTRDAIEDESSINAIRELEPTRLVEIDLQPLSSADAARFARSLLGLGVADADEVAQGIAAGSGGVPFFIERLSRWYEELGAPPDTSLDQLTSQLVARASEGARCTLELLVVAGHPVAVDELAQISGCDVDSPAFLELERAQLIRRHWQSGNEQVDVIHDRVRESVADGLHNIRTASYHERWITQLQAARQPDAERLAEHLLRAGRRAEAAVWARRAADVARDALAFDRAAKTYGLALECGSHTPAEALELLDSRADALAKAGIGFDAAQEFKAAASLATGERRIRLLRRASELLLVSGHYDDGIALAREVLAEVGMRSSPGTAAALARIASEALRMAGRGRGWIETPADEIPSELLARIDLCWSMVLGLLMIEPVHSADFSLRHLRMALDAGEPFRVCRALLVDAAFSMALGRSREQTARLWGQARALLERVEDPYLRGLCQLMGALEASGDTDWTRASSRSQLAAHIFRTECIGAWTEIAWAETASFQALSASADLAELARKLPTALRRAQDRGDQLSEILHRSAMLPAIFLGRDEPEAALESLQRGIDAWGSGGFQVVHWVAQQMYIRIHLYQGDALIAWQHQRGAWRRLVGSMLLRVPGFGLETAHLSGAAALAVAAQAATRRERVARLAEAAGFARRAEKLRLANSVGVAHILYAGVARLNGDLGAALVHLEEAAYALDSAGCTPWAVAAQRCSELLRHGPGDGATAAEGRLRGFGIHNAEKMCRVLVPGFSAHPPYVTTK